MDRKTKLRGVCLLTVLLVVVTGAFAEQTAMEKAADLIAEGIAHIYRVGEDQAFKDFSDREGPFVDGAFYIFVVDFDGITLAHGGNPALVGMNMSELKDANGVYFIREFIKAAQTNGEGWVDYKWSNPETKRIEDKTSLVKRFGTSSYFLGCGIYKEN